MFFECVVYLPHPFMLMIFNEKNKDQIGWWFVWFFFFKKKGVFVFDTSNRWTKKGKLVYNGEFILCKDAYIDKETAVDIVRSGTVKLIKVSGNLGKCVEKNTTLFIFF
jgi:hypothetical protein